MFRWLILTTPATGIVRVTQHHNGGFDPGGAQSEEPGPDTLSNTEARRSVGSRMALRRECHPGGDPILAQPLGESSQAGDLQLSFARHPLVMGIWEAASPSHIRLPQAPRAIRSSRTSLG